MDISVNTGKRHLTKDEQEFYTPGTESEVYRNKRM